MSKTVKNSLIIIAIVVVLFGIAWLVYDMLKSDPVDAEVNTNLADDNTGLDNMINELLDNTIENAEVQNVLENAMEDAKNDVAQTGQGTDTATTREEKAIALAKKEWGSTDGVYFSNESIDSQGRYIISVRDKKTTASLIFYLVDVDKQLVTEQ